MTVIQIIILKLKVKKENTKKMKMKAKVIKNFLSNDAQITVFIKNMKD